MSDETPCQHPGCGCHAAHPSSDPASPKAPRPFTVGPGFILLCLGGVALIAFIVYLFVPLKWLLGKQTVQTRALAHARMTYMTLNIYAHENAGQYPQLPANAGEGNANLVYQQLVPFYLNGHKESFHLEGSAWTPQPLGAIKSAPDQLAAGENFLAYVTGLSRESNPRLPIVADGFAEGQPGVYATEPGVRGSMAERLPVIIRVDGSALLTKPNENGRISRGNGNDYFTPAEGWLTEKQRPLNPAK